jgi:hypothetical protein
MLMLVLIIDYKGKAKEIEEPHKAEEPQSQDGRQPQDSTGESSGSDTSVAREHAHLLARAEAFESKLPSIEKYFLREIRVKVTQGPKHDTDILSRKDEILKEYERVEKIVEGIEIRPAILHSDFY